MVLDGVEGILFVYYLDGRLIGDVFVFLVLEEDVVLVFKKYREIMGICYIELFKSIIVEV